MAVKVLSKRPVNINYLERELRIQYACDHPNILKLYGITIDNSGFPAMVLEYADKTLFDVIKKRNRLSNEQKIEITKEITEALVYLHQHNFIHRDLKVCMEFSFTLSSKTSSWPIIMLRSPISVLLDPCKTVKC